MGTNVNKIISRRMKLRGCLLQLTWGTHLFVSQQIVGVQLQPDWGAIYPALIY